MSKEKIAILEQVMEQIERNSTISCNYIDNRGCKCAVGYIMDQCGVDMEFFDRHDKVNDETIDRLIVAFPRAMEPLQDYGFTSEELQQIQNINDSADDSYQRAEEVINYMYAMIRELKQTV